MGDVSNLFPASILILFTSFHSFGMENKIPDDQVRFWGQNGDYKVLKEDRPLIDGKDFTKTNSVWDGSRISLTSFRNESVSFAIVIENESELPVALRFDLGFHLKSKKGAKIESVLLKDPKLSVKHFNEKPIEFFRIGYLPIRGLSLVSYSSYDERHIPDGLRAKHDANGNRIETKPFRSGIGKSYPEIAIPLELNPNLRLDARSSQMIWVDVWVDEKQSPGIYTGAVKFDILRQKDAEESANIQHRTMPISLDVRSATLDLGSRTKAVAFLGFEDWIMRYFGKESYQLSSDQKREAEWIRDRHFQLAHRHLIDLIDSNESIDIVKNPGGNQSFQPYERWRNRLSGDLYQPKFEYEGPEEGIGNQFFSIGAYGSVLNQVHEKKEYIRTASAWDSWFSKHFPKVRSFIYLEDESPNLTKVNQDSAWFKEGATTATVKTFATNQLPSVLNARGGSDKSFDGSPDILASHFVVGKSADWANGFEKWKKVLKRDFWLYNGRRPATPSFAIEDDGISLIAIPWIQKKFGIETWFFWHSTYYNNYQGGMGQTDVFVNGQTFGKSDRFDPVLGQTGWNYSNGDGVLFYPGKDQIFKASDHSVNMPFASLRMKYWRRGLFDSALIAQASKVDAVATSKIVQKLIPKVLWEVGVSDLKDPTWVRGPMGWSTNSDDWAIGRDSLRRIIERKP